MTWLSGWPGWVDWHRWRDKSLQYEDGYKTNGVKHEERPVSSFGNQSDATISARVANASENKRSEFCFLHDFQFHYVCKVYLVQMWCIARKIEPTTSHRLGRLPVSFCLILKALIFCNSSIDTPSANAFVIKDGYQHDVALSQLTFGHMLERLCARVAL